METLTEVVFTPHNVAAHESPTSHVTHCPLLGVWVVSESSTVSSAQVDAASLKLRVKQRCLVRTLAAFCLAAFQDSSFLCPPTSPAWQWPSCQRRCCGPNALSMWTGFLTHVVNGRHRDRQLGFFNRPFRSRGFGQSPALPVPRDWPLQPCSRALLFPMAVTTFSFYFTASKAGYFFTSTPAAVVLVR